MKINFNGNEYQKVHGKAPRGNGSWGFQICNINDHEWIGKVHFTTTQPLTEAKRWIKTIIEMEAVKAIFDVKTIEVDILP